LTASASVTPPDFEAERLQNTFRFRVCPQLKRRQSTAENTQRTTLKTMVTWKPLPKHVTTASAISFGLFSALALFWYRQQQVSRRKLLKADGGAALERERQAVKDSPNGAKFMECASRIRKIPSEELASGEKLVLYSLYKQAIVGDAPYMFELGRGLGQFFEEQAKHSAWSGVRGMEKEEAIARYITAVMDIEERRAKGITGDDGEEENELLQGLAQHVSRPAVENGGYEEDDGSKPSPPETLLLRSAASNDVAKIRELASSGTSVDHKDESGQTALHLAADKGSVDCIRALLDAGANVNATDNDGISVLQAAVIAGNVDVCRLLLDAGANPDQADLDGDTPRSCAADDGTEEMELLFAQ